MIVIWWNRFSSFNNFLNWVQKKQPGELYITISKALILSADDDSDDGIDNDDDDDDDILFFTYRVVLLLFEWYGIM